MAVFTPLTIRASSAPLVVAAVLATSVPVAVAGQEAAVRNRTDATPTSVVFLRDSWLPGQPSAPLPSPPQQVGFRQRDDYLFEGLIAGLFAGMMFAMGSTSMIPVVAFAAAGTLLGHSVKKAPTGLGTELVQSVRGGAVPAAETLPPDLQRAAALIEAGHADSALGVVRAYLAGHRDDPRGFLLLGDAQLEFASDSALWAYEEAELLDPTDPAPSYRIARVAMLRGRWNDEARAREALEKVLGLDPGYQDAWRLWRMLYRSPEARRVMIRQLLPHEAQPAVKGMLAQLAIEEERYWAADRLLDAALATDSLHPGWLALRAQSALEAGDTLVGLGFYRRALANASTDSAGVLWDQVVGIARPEEIRAWQAGVPPEERGAWLESFWARRNPDLFAGVNQRVAEHFTRWRHARREYPLLYPLVGFQRSEYARALTLQPSRGERQFHLRCETVEAPAPSGLSVTSPGARGGVVGRPTGLLAYLTDQEKEQIRDLLAQGQTPSGFLAVALEVEGARALEPTVFPFLGYDLRGVDSTAARIGYNLAAGLSDRGLAYLRLGAPERRILGGDNALQPDCNTTELERWRYDEWGELRFARPSAFSDQATLSEVVFRPMEEPQFEATRTALTEDATSLPAPLEFGVWTASLRDPRDPSRTDLLVVSSHGALAATLVGATGGERAFAQSPRGVVSLRDLPGAYTLLAHARVGDVLGRQELRVDVRSFAETPAVSDLLVARTWPEAVVGREEMVQHVSRDLTFQNGDPVRAYAELYGLADAGGQVHYRVSYQLLRTRDLADDYLREEWPDAVRLEFERQAAAAAVVREVLDINPVRIPPGTWLLRVTVEDLVAGVPTGSATVAFQVLR